jgi:hypothetical protein
MTGLGFLKNIAASSISLVEQRVGAGPKIPLAVAPLSPRIGGGFERLVRGSTIRWFLSPVSRNSQRLRFQPTTARRTHGAP